MTEVVNGSIGLKVVGFFSWCGSGRLSQSRRWPWKP
jgi:hypothetical protein